MAISQSQIISGSMSEVANCRNNQQCRPYTFIVITVARYYKPLYKKATTKPTGKGQISTQFRGNYLTDFDET